MADKWSELMFASSYNGLPLQLATASDDLGRALVIHEYRNVDGAEIDDQGAHPRRCRCQIAFFEDGTEPGHIARAEKFVEYVNDGKAYEFVHPITGSYKARVQGLNRSISANRRELILIECEFLEDGTRSRIASVHMTVTTAVENVNINADAAIVELEKQGIKSTVPAQAKEAAAKWDNTSEPGALDSIQTTVREVNQQMASVSDAIESAVRDLELATNIDKWPLFKQYTRLHSNLRLAAEAFRSTRDNITQVTERVGRPLRVLVTEFYGATEGVERYAEVVQLNDIGDPSYIAPGRKISMHTPNATGQRGTRSA